MHQSRELESPRRFFYWAGLSALSAVLGRKVYLDRFAYKLYPNMYVVLVGRSGLRKGIPVATAQALVRKTESIKVISGRSSIQAVIEELAHSEINQHGKLSNNGDSSGFLCSGEMSQSLLADDQALTILTNLYDGHYNDEFTNLLKSGRTVLKNVYLCMLGASNETHLNVMITRRDMMGGFVARTIMVVENDRANINSLVDKPDTTLDIDGLAEYLTTLSTLEGQFQLRADAKTLYREWYENLQNDDSDDTGFSERIHDHVLKVAMLLSASRSYSLEIIDEDIHESIEVCNECMGSTRRVTMRSSAYADSQTTAVVLQALLAAPDSRLSRQSILKRFWKEGVNAEVLNSVIETMQNAGVLSVERGDNDVIYALQGWFVDEYRKKLQTKKS
jgi:hypothetical protein